MLGRGVQIPMVRVNDLLERTAWEITSRFVAYFHSPPAKLRLRPIVMTSLAFGFGLLPLAFASGAGAGAQKAIGTSVLGGVATSTFLVTLFAPLFYVLIQKAFGKNKKREEAAKAETPR
jgi:Cu/Ag efflux pump CusA